jgi:PAS domain S-box-containing protein
MEHFSKLMNVATAIMDLDGNVIVAANWKDICTKFHRKHPKTSELCRQSDNYIKDHLDEGGPIEYRCANGMRDLAVPIYVHGQHMATFFVGQFIYEDEKLDIEYFRNQAVKYGFDVDSYLSALELVPVISRDIVKSIVEYCLGIVDMLARMGSEKIILLETERSLRFSQVSVERSADAIFWMDSEGRIVYANESACRGLGYTPDEILEADVFKLDPCMPREAWANHWASLKGCGSLTFESEHQRKDGTRFPVEITSNFIEYDGMEYNCPLARDISERKLAQQAMLEHTANLQKANFDLVTKNAELDEFTYVASHDLQEPLRKLTAFSGLLAKDAGDALPDRARKDLTFITDAANRMQGLIQDLLTLSRVGRKSMRQEPVSLDACVDEALGALSVRVEESSAKIVRSELGEVVGDQMMITQLFQNLIGNALKFVNDTQPIVTINAQHTDDIITVSVTDNGIGINPDYFDQIFMPFKRLHGREEYAGTGIGLSICRKTVERHGGNIWVESEPQKGSSFIFSLHKRNLEELNDAA